MRLNRAILLNHLKTVMETPVKTLTPQQLAELRSTKDALLDGLYDAPYPQDRPDGEGLLDDDSEDGEEDPEVEPPLRKQNPIPR
jgi:hypothetical protein